MTLVRVKNFDVIQFQSWQVLVNIDDDGHLNLYVTNLDSDIVNEVETGQGDGLHEHYAVRFTTPEIEKRAEEN